MLSVEKIFKLEQDTHSVTAIKENTSHQMVIPCNYYGIISSLYSNTVKKLFILNMVVCYCYKFKMKKYLQEIYGHNLSFSIYLLIDWCYQFMVNKIFFLCV